MLQEMGENINNKRKNLPLDCAVAGAPPHDILAVVALLPPPQFKPDELGAD